MLIADVSGFAVFDDSSGYVYFVIGNGLGTGGFIYRIIGRYLGWVELTDTTR